MAGEGQNSPELSISILDLDLQNIRNSFDALREIGIKSVHVDIIDTSFTNNISFGLNTVNWILEQPGFSFFVHVMVQKPAMIIHKLKYPSGTRLAIHSDYDCIRHIKEVIPVLAISPDQKIDGLLEEIKLFQEVLIMTVEPGFGGQELIEECIDKIDECKQLGKRVTVDGGVNLENIRKVRKADAIVVGSAFTKANDKAGMFQKLLCKMNTYNIQR